MGLKKLSAEPAEGRSTQVWADSARSLGVCRLGAGELFRAVHSYPYLVWAMLPSVKQLI